MKKIFFLSLLLSSLLVTAGPQKKAPVVGKKGPYVVLFNGGRPRMGNIVSQIFEKAGCKVVNINGTYLDGFSGAPIRINMTDKVEPTPFDGITPALKQLGNKKLVIFNDIPAAMLTKMLDEKRIAQLKSFVEKGGHILFTRDCPASVGDLLPVSVGETMEVEVPLFADRPAGKIFAIFPEKLPVLSNFRQLTVLPGAEVLSTIRANDTEITPFLVRKTIGKGTVTYLNTKYSYAHSLQDFSNWAYGKAFLTAVAADAGNYKAAPEKLISKMQDIPAREEVGEVAVSVQTPALGIEENQSTPHIDGKKITFGNGIVLDVSADGKVAITYPCEKEPLIRNYAIPEIGFSEERSFFDAKTAEATDGEAVVKAADIKWNLKNVAVNKNSAVLTYVAKDAEMRWIFTAGTLRLDGRDFAGFADRVEMVKSPLLLNEIVFHSELTPEKPLFARRNSCYSPPRGYVDFDMTGKVDADTYTWRYFGSGQPFEHLVCEDGLYLGNVESAQAVIVRFTRKKGAKSIANLRRHTLGRIYAPCATVNYWHWFSRGAERGHNDYLAMYQFVRKDLRRRAGLKEFPAYPICSYTHQITKEEAAQVRAAAIKAGYRYLSHPGCEEPADASFSSDRFPIFNEMRQNNVGSRIWTAGSYVQGDGGWIYNHHPEWFVRDSKGEIFAYGNGRYPVIDVNNEEYFKWFRELVKPAIDAGVRWVYRDMDGAAANCINFAKKESPHGMEMQIKIYRFFHENDCRVAIEGMNPLVLDEYWYRPHLYTPFAGKEFCLVGSVPSANFYEGLELDFFRTGMYGCFPLTELSGYTFQFDRIKDEVVRANRMVSLVPKFNEALDNTGMPFVRETPFGTTWIGDKGGALFFWNPAKKVTVDLPAGWKIKGAEGNVLTDVKADSIYLLEKK